MRYCVSKKTGQRYVAVPSLAEIILITGYLLYVSFGKTIFSTFGILLLGRVIMSLLSFVKGTICSTKMLQREDFVLVECIPKTIAT
ncbi:hypothetical protein BKA69DRAFT_1099935 [Paraphysoderma sedebokerense]|nr:hypothetical protein BKA69DRAFT_1099935 [Paraphysoderma sedebokerense]